MTGNFDALNLVPRHISKHFHRQKKAAEVARQSDQLRLDQPISLWGTIGCETDYNHYPDAASQDLRKALAALQSVETRQIFLGNGSDEVLDLLVRAFCMPGKDHAIAFAPAAARFEHVCAINGVHLHELPLTSEFQLPIYKAKTSFTDQTKVLFISNPNPITGVPVRNFDIVDVLDAFEGIVVIDESLIEYSEEGGMLEHLHQYPNMVVVQSFSHAWGMAGLRLGVAYGHPSVIAILESLRMPHNINSAAQSVALRAIECAHERASVITETIHERERLRTALLQFKFIDEVEYSQANILLVRSGAPELLLKYLAEENIVVADVSGLQGCAGCVRITVGTSSQNDQLIRALNEMAVKMSPMRRLMKAVNTTLKKAGVFLGFFKKMFSGGA